MSKDFQKYDIAVVGGGLAGLCNAIHLSKAGCSVVLIEKNEFPRHKVCGEYISNEVLPYLNWLGFDPFHFGATRLRVLELGTKQGKAIQGNLPLGGFGISRYTIDDQLMQLAQNNGCTIVNDTVKSVDFQKDHFKLMLKSNRNILATFTIGAFGKRSNLDSVMNRDFIKEKSPYLGVKAHYSGEYPTDKVGLYTFDGGYCGVSKVENDFINICYLTNYESFKSYKDLDEFQEKVLSQNKHLAEIFSNSKMAFEKPLTISQVSFSPKKTVENHVLMSGDSAGMIHPLCGNGMGMAIHSAMICSELIIENLEEGSLDRNQVAQMYSKRWNRIFRKRLLAGRIFNKFLYNEKRLGQAINALMVVPSTLPFLIRQTHGEMLVPPTNKS